MATSRSWYRLYLPVPVYLRLAPRLATNGAPWVPDLSTISTLGTGTPGAASHVNIANTRRRRVRTMAWQRTASGLVRLLLTHYRPYGRLGDLNNRLIPLLRVPRRGDARAGAQRVRARCFRPSVPQNSSYRR